MYQCSSLNDWPRTRPSVRWKEMSIPSGAWLFRLTRVPALAAPGKATSAQHASPNSERGIVTFPFQTAAHTSHTDGQAPDAFRAEIEIFLRPFSRGARTENARQGGGPEFQVSNPSLHTPGRPATADAFAAAAAELNR